MDMNFPHHDASRHAANVHARRTRTECGAYISVAMVRQNGGATAAAMAHTANEGKAYGYAQNDTLEARMHYFSGAAYTAGAYPTGAHPASVRSAPYGAFMPRHNTEFRNAANYDQAVYQDGLVISKLQDIFNTESELQITKPGQEN